MLCLSREEYNREARELTSPEFVIGWVISQPRWGIRWRLIFHNRHRLARERSLEEVQTLGQRDGFGAAAHAQLAIDTADLGFNRIGGDNQILCHLCVRPPVNQQTQHPLFLGTQWLDDRSLNGALWWLWQGLLHGGR